MKIKLNKLVTNQAPTKGHSTDAGYDIYSPIDFLVSAKSISPRINLGVGFEIPKGYVGIITERSSQGKKGYHTLGNIVDHGYTGDVHVTIANESDEVYNINKGDRICQIVVVPVLMEDLEEVEEFESTERGDGAHGSTGK